MFHACFLPSSGEPPEHYDCSNNNANPIQYQLLQYSELDQYSIPCTVKPGKLRDRYSIAWFSIQSGNFGSLTTVDMSNFDVRINSTSLPRYENWLSCRVDIDHAGGNVRQYCGRRMRAAGNTLCVGDVLDFRWKFMMFRTLLHLNIYIMTVCVPLITLKAF